MKYFSDERVSPAQLRAPWSTGSRLPDPNLGCHYQPDTGKYLSMLQFSLLSNQIIVAFLLAPRYDFHGAYIMDLVFALPSCCVLMSG